MFENIKADSYRYKTHGGWLKNIGFWITLCYRFGVWVKSNKFLLIKIPLKMIYYIFCFFIRTHFQVILSPSTKIGGGLLLLHPSSIIIDEDAIIGSNCSIYNDITIGRGTKIGAPILDDNVVIFPGARILGGIKLGDNAHIGANTVVQSDVTSWSMVIAPLPKRFPMSLTKKILEKNINDT